MAYVNACSSVRSPSMEYAPLSSWTTFPAHQSPGNVSISPFSEKTFNLVVLFSCSFKGAVHINGRGISCFFYYQLSDLAANHPECMHVDKTGSWSDLSFSSRKSKKTVSITHITNMEIRCFRNRYALRHNTVSCCRT